ncbi:MAG: glycosyltransferase family 39 protein [Candidatus Kapabacteria bacterium]|nr:glycosyltransferase family 39 protein [Candidatus Kapabacteria bacterium]
MNTSAILHDVRRQRLLILAVGLLLFVPFLGSVRLFDWDEINFAECAREMIVTGDYLHMQIDYRPFTEKPPLFVWAQVALMHVFGINEFAARLPNAIVGVITLLVLHSIGRRLHGNGFGLIWPLVYAGTLLPHFYARSGIIDPMFNLFIFLAIWQLIRGELDGASRYVQAGIFAGLAVMTKGPVGLGLVVLTVIAQWIAGKRSTASARPFPAAGIAVIIAIACILPALWLGLDAMANGPQFLLENLQYQWRLLTQGEAGHAQPWYYHSLVLLIGCYPTSVFFLVALRKRTDLSDDERTMRRWMIVLFFVVLVVFSAVTTKIVHYSSMTYIPLTYLAATWIVRRGVVTPAINVAPAKAGAQIEDVAPAKAGAQIEDVAPAKAGAQIEQSHITDNPWAPASAGATGLIILAHSILIGGIAIIVPLAFMNSEWMLSLPSFRDPFLREAMSRKVEWLGIEPFIGLILIVGACAFAILLRRKPLAGIIALYASVMLFIFAFLPLVAPKIEAYSQGAALDFYQSLRGRDVYAKPLTMKSYAHLFYTDKPPDLSSAAKGIDVDAWEPWLINGPVDRPVRFVCRVNDLANWKDQPNLRELYREGGFVFFERITSPMDPPSQNR